MILGIGTDLIDIRRIQRTLDRFGERFTTRCFTASERTKCDTRLLRAASYAKRYAAKEACSKALGTGLARGIFWKDIEVINDKFGKPSILFHNNALKRIKEISLNNYKIDVTLSDEKKYAIANVIISKI